MTVAKNEAGSQSAVSAASDADEGRRLAFSCWMAYAGTAVILLAVILSCAALFATREERMVKRQLEDASQLLASELSDRTAAVRHQLQRWRDDDRLRAALRDGRTSVLRAQEEALALMVPGLLGLRLLPAAETVPGGATGSRLSYAPVSTWCARSVRPVRSGCWRRIA